jgi:HK97 family phage major capsid protein
MKTLKTALAELEAKANEAKALYAKGETATAEDLEQVKTLSAEMTALETEIEGIKAFEAEQAKNEARLNNLTQVQSFSLPTGDAQPKGSATSFTGTDSEKKAFRFGQWFKAAVTHDQKAMQYCKDNIGQFTMSGDSATAGGALVPTEFRADLQVLMEKYGALRQLVTPWQMTSDTQIVPRLTGGLTVYSPGQGTAITASDPTFDVVTLKADTFATLTYVPLELLADSPIQIGNMVFDLIAQAFAENEDNMFINGDGTATYFGRVGLATAFRKMDPSWNSTTLTNVANIAGAYVQTNKAFASQVIADLNGVEGLLPEYAEANAKWLCSKKYKVHTMNRLAYGMGGVTVAEITRSVGSSFNGFPVVTSPKAPSATAGAIDAAAGGIPVYLGDFQKGVAFGDRQSYTIAQSEHVGFASNVLAIRGTERIDFVVHGVGNYSATAASRVPGPIVCGISPHT